MNVSQRSQCINFKVMHHVNNMAGYNQRKPLNTTFIIIKLITGKLHNVKKKTQEGVYIRCSKHNILYMSVLKAILEPTTKIY